MNPETGPLSYEKEIDTSSLRYQELVGFMPEDERNNAQELIDISDKAYEADKIARHDLIKKSVLDLEKEGITREDLQRCRLFYLLSGGSQSLESYKSMETDLPEQRLEKFIREELATIKPKDSNQSQ